MRIAIYILTAFFFLLLSFISNGQNNSIDSLKQVLQTQKEDSNKVNTLNQLSQLVIQSNIDGNGRHFADQALTLAKKLKFQRGQADALQNIAYLYINQNKATEARNYLMEALSLARTTNDIELKAKILNVVAQTYMMEENYPEALHYLYQSLSDWEKNKNDVWMASTLAAIGYVRYYQGELQTSLMSWWQARDLFERIGDKSELARSYIALSILYQNLDSLEASLKNLSFAENIYNELNDKTGMFYVFQGYGDVTEKQAKLASPQESVVKYQLAVKHYNSALNMAEETSDRLQMAQANTHMGRINIKLKDLTSARKNLLKSLELGFDNKENLKSVYKHLSTLDSLEGNYRAAYQNYQKYILYRDSLVNDQGSKKSLQARMQYDFDKKEAAAKAEQYKKDEAARRTRNLQYFAIAIVLILAMFLLIYSRQKQKAKSKIEKAYADLKSTQSQLIQSEKMASLGELTAGIAHEIQNPLNFVNNFSDVNAELVEELKSELTTGNIQLANEIADSIKENEQKINHHGKRADAIVKNMLQHSRNSSGKKEPTDINALVDEYLRLAYHGFRAKDKSFNADIETDFDNSIVKINITPQDIGRVVLNVINNAFYAVNEKQKQSLNGFEPIVSVSTKKDKNKVEIKIIDNGNGISPEVLGKIFQPFFTTKPTGQGTGLGLSLSFDIVKAHGGELKVETKEGEGSEFIIRLPAN